MSKQATCIVCGKQFTGRSVPQWVFHTNMTLLGLIHTGCLAQSQPTHRGWIAWRTNYSHGDLELGRFTAWLFAIPTERGTDRDLARMLGLDKHREPLAQFDDKLEVRLEWWCTGPMKLPRERCPFIRAAYQDLVREYEELGERAGWGKTAATP